MTPKRFELKIPLDLLARIEEAARDYFKSPLNHTSKKPELTSPILKLIELGLEKIAESPVTGTTQIDTDCLNALIDERIKAHLSVYQLEKIQALINNLELVGRGYETQNIPVLNTDNNQVLDHASIPDSRTSQSLDQIYTVLNTDKETTEVETLVYPECLAAHPDESVKLTDSYSEQKTPLHTSQPTEVFNPTDSIQVESVDETAIESLNQTTSVLNLDITTDSTQVSILQDKPKARSGAKITLKGARKHAQDKGFNGTADEFRNLFKRSGDVHYGIKILYLSGAGSSRNYELLG